MRKLTVLFMAVVMVLASCANATSSSPAPTPTINGTWTWATIQGSPVGLAGYSGTLTITNAASYSLTTHMTKDATEVGTVALKSGSTYTLTSTGTVTGAPGDFTLSSDGKTLSGTHWFLSAVTFTK